ncbi:aldo/keto reductase [Thalassoroseus pseudoceratinae]|uniref:aldo/keto reductase n=1 Tax=Thalassoroseus pseudoceratinae TaxID=2713176 RepID=UPI0014238A82|nr:aldo/keto reductase [Thalassoroseus pseudoceratinae]
MADQPTTRREFLQTGVVAGAAVSLAKTLFAAQEQREGGIPTRPLGNTGENVSILSLGGWHIGQAAKDNGEEFATKLMHEAIDNGLNFFDNAWDYHNGYSEEVMGKALKGGKRDDVFLMTKICERDYKGAMANLDESLKRLQTDHLDLWQFHEMVYDNDPDWVFEKGGIKAAIEAQKAGKVRHIGFTGHKDPSIHLKMLGKPHTWASAQMPINACDWHFRSFAKEVVPVCLEKGVGVIGMKSLGGGSGILVQEGVLTGPECLKYALSQPIASLVTGIINQRDLDQAIKVGRDFKPLTDDELDRILQKVAPVAGDGRHELFKTSKRFDGPHHRKQHGFPLDVNS